MDCRISEGKFDEKQDRWMLKVSPHEKLNYK